VYLLDTNIVSEVLRRRPDPKVIARLSQVEPEEIHASVITLFELRFGSMLRDVRRSLGKRSRRRFSRWFAGLMSIDPQMAFLCLCGESVSVSPHVNQVPPVPSSPVEPSSIFLV
jgi:toxin FitB